MWVVFLSLFLSIACWAQDPVEEGIQLFHEKKYDSALVLFETDHARLTPLVGRLYCYVALGRLDQIDPSIQLIHLKLQEFTNCDKPPVKGPITPEQQLLSYQCRRHTREVANQMRRTVEKLVRETVPGIFQKIKVLRQLYPFIDALEQVGIDCCRNNFPLECCLDPMLLQLDAWETLGLQER